MKKRMWLVVLAVVVLAAGIGGTTVLAQDEPTVPPGNWWGAAPAHCWNVMNGGFDFGGRGYYGIGDRVTLTRVAGVLGLTYDELNTRLAQGETIAQVAESKGVALSLVVDTIVAPQSETLQVRVKYGYLTNDQAQSILEQVRYRVEQAITLARTGASAPTTGPASGYNQPYAPRYGGMMGGGRGGMWNW